MGGAAQAGTGRKGKRSDPEHTRTRPATPPLEAQEHNGENVLARCASAPAQRRRPVTPASQSAPSPGGLGRDPGKGSHQALRKQRPQSQAWPQSAHLSPTPTSPGRRPGAVWGAGGVGAGGARGKGGTPGGGSRLREKLPSWGSGPAPWESPQLSLTQIRFSANDPWGHLLHGPSTKSGAPARLTPPCFTRMSDSSHPENVRGSSCSLQAQPLSLEKSWLLKTVGQYSLNT